MEIFVGAAVAAVVSALVVVLMGRTRVAHAGPRVVPRSAPGTRADMSAATATAPASGGSRARSPKAPTDGQSASPPAVREAIDDELRERRAEIARIEERVLSKEEKLAVRLADLERRETSLEDRQRNLDHEGEKLKTAKQGQVRELERISGLTAAQARQVLLRELEDEIRTTVLHELGHYFGLEEGQLGDLGYE